jgi:uncharacterized membrane protein
MWKTRLRPLLIGLPNYLHFIFPIYSTAICTFLVFAFPPFMGADELNHFLRADTITLGGVIGQRVDTAAGPVAGGMIDAMVMPAYGPFQRRIEKKEKITALDLAIAEQPFWDGWVEPQPFLNTAVYSPIFYIPQSAAIFIGKTVRLSILHTLYLARLFNAIACILVGTLALFLAPCARPFLFTIMLLPISLALYAGVSPDGLTIVTTVLATAIILQALHVQRALSKQEVVCVSFALALVALTKQHLVILNFILLAIPMQRTSWRYLATALSILPAAAWFAWMSYSVQTPLPRPGMALDPKGQVQALFSDPAAAWQTLANTLDYYGYYLAIELVGALGWIDTFMPLWYYYIFWIAIPVAAISGMSLKRSREWRLLHVAVPVVVVGCSLAIYGAFLVFYTPVGWKTVDGIQGRYFIPLITLLALAFTGSGADDVTFSNIRRSLAFVLAALPLVTMVVIPNAVITRYYLS